MKKFMLIVLIVFGFMITLGAGTVAGASLAYVLLRARPVQASALNAVEIAQITQDREKGILVSGVVDGSPAAEAGIVRGDIIVSIDGVEVNQIADLDVSMEAMQAGDSVSFRVLHGDDIRTIDVTIPVTLDDAYLGIKPCADVFSFHPFIGTPREGGPDMRFLAASGAYISSIVEASPAAEAGLQVGDIIQAVGETEVSAADDLASLIGAYAPGDTVTLTVQREGETNPLMLDVTLGANPDDNQRPYLGVSYQPASGMLHLDEGQLPLDQLPFGQGIPQIKPFDLPQGVENAVFVAEVVANTPAEQAGLVSGDFITEVDGQVISDSEQLVQVIQGHKPGDEVTLTVWRQGASDSEMVVVTLGEHPDNADQAYLGVKIQSVTNVQETMPPGLENFQFPGWPFENPGQTPPPSLQDQGESG